MSKRTKNIGFIAARYFIVAAFFFLMQSFQLTYAHQETGEVFTPVSGDVQSLKRYETVFIDPTRQLTFQDILGKHLADFKHIEPPSGFSQDIYWIQVTVDFHHFHEPYSYLFQEFRMRGNITLYYPNEKGYAEYDIVKELPMAGREIATRHYFFEIPTPSSGTATYFIKVNPRGSIPRLEYSWAGVKQIIAYNGQSHWLLGLIFGALGALFLYNVCIWSITQDKAYLAYLFYLGSVFFIIWDVNGQASLYEMFSVAKTKFYAICSLTSLLGIILFHRSLFSLKETAPWLDKFFVWNQIILYVAAFVIVFIFPVEKAYVLPFYLTTPSFIGILLTYIVRWKFPPSKFCIFGVIGYASMMTLYTMESTGKITFTHSAQIALYAAQFGAVWEAIMLSFALASRIKISDAQARQLLESERDRLDHLVSEKTADLRASLESNRNLVANVSHELRSPVNALQLILEASEVTEFKGSNELMARVHSLAVHMSQLVENLLLINADRQGYENAGLIQRFDLGEEIRATCKMLWPMRRGSMANFTYNVHGCNGLMVRGDLPSLRRIIINLITNAFKFTVEGHVKLNAQAELDELSKKVTCSISIQDTGIGIPVEMHERIFDAFVTSGTHSGQTGTGLGLAISRKLANKMGGTLELVKSAPGIGSEFNCTVVLETITDFPEAALESKESGTVVVPIKKRLRVLFAEDDEVTAQAVLLIIRHLQHDVAHVSTYEELHDALMDHGDEFDLALIDHRLPGGNGLDAIKKYRKNQSSTGLRLVLMTADVTFEVLQEADKICDEVISKPTQASRLRHLLGEGEEKASEPHRRLIDPDVLNVLKQNGIGSADLVDICELFHSVISATIENMAKLISVQNHIGTTEEVKALVHKVKSACVTVGAEALNAEFGQLKWTQGKSGLKEQIERIRTTHQVTKHALNDLLETLT